MPRIRKKTSKRGTSNQRQRIKHKVAETRKKRKKEAKKNMQWKSKNPKDPGIPNSFPYKDQILAEVQEERRQAAEAKQKRKEERQAAKAKGTEDVSDGESEDAFDGVRSLAAGTTKGASAENDRMMVDDEEEEEEEDVPVLLDPDFPNLKLVLDAADVVLQVLDARNPLASKSAQIEELAKGKKALLVLNKVDTVPKEAVTAWATSLRTQSPTVPFRSASAFLPAVPEPTGKGKDKQRADDAWGTDSVLSCLKSWAAEKDGDTLVVVVVGIVNAGKTSFLNSLLRKAALATYKLTGSTDGMSTTSHPQEVTLEADGKTIRLIDTPGLSWHPSPDLDEQQIERVRARDILLRSRGKIERLKDPIPVVAEIISHASREDLMLFYNLPAFAEGDVNAFLTGLARSHNLLKKGGLPDLTGASRILLRDWNTGKFPRYTLPPTSSSTAAPTTEAVLADVYAKDEQILAKLPTRKEMRKAGGVVKMAPGEVESRYIVLDASWLGVESDGNDGDESDEEDELDEDVSGEVDEDGMDDEGDSDPEDEDEEMDIVDESIPGKGKRKRAARKASAPARPVKKVAFAEPKSSKRESSRSASKAKNASAAPAKATPAGKSSKLKLNAQKGLVATSTGQKATRAASKKLPVHAGEEAYDFKKFF